jgi:hypothetical protein
VVAAPYRGVLVVQHLARPWYGRGTVRGYRGTAVRYGWVL